MNPTNGELEHDNEVFDASAILAILQDEPGSEKLLKLRAGALVSAVNAAEVLAKLVSRGMGLREASAAFEALDLDVIPFTPHLAAISARYVKKGVSLGDRSFLATVYQHGRGWTSDRDLPKLVGNLTPRLSFFR
ncbi:MAG TPA: PIN domain-containing protein [Bryobacteraceae bacterium]